MITNQLRKILPKNRLCLLLLIIFFLSISVTSAQEKVVVIPLFDDQKPAGPPSPIPKTGQTIPYGTGEDGDLERGLAWPTPRFTINGDGTVTDRLTGLIWMKNANCFGQRAWGDALNDCNALADGSCGLTDGSKAGDWSLANIRELQSLIHYGVWGPALPNAAGTSQWTEGDPFTGVEASDYWSSTSHANTTSNAWDIYIFYGHVEDVNKSNSRYVWCVRGGQ